MGCVEKEETFLVLLGMTVGRSRAGLEHSATPLQTQHHGIRASREMPAALAELIGFRGSGRRDERDVVFLHRVVERGDIFRKDFAPLHELSFQLRVEFGEHG